LAGSAPFSLEGERLGMRVLVVAKCRRKRMKYTSRLIYQSVLLKIIK